MPPVYRKWVVESEVREGFGISEHAVSFEIA